MIQSNTRNSIPGIYLILRKPESLFTQFSARLTEANPSTFVAFLPVAHAQHVTVFVFINRARSVHNSNFVTLGATYIGDSSTRHIHNLMKSQLYTYPVAKDA